MSRYYRSKIFVVYGTCQYQVRGSNLTVYILLNEPTIDVRIKLGHHSCIYLATFPDECLTNSGEKSLEIM